MLKEGLALAAALKSITSNPANIYKLSGKGSIRRGFDADFVLLDPERLSIDAVYAMGRAMVEDGRALVKGTFEAA